MPGYGPSASRQEWCQWIPGQAATRCVGNSRLHYRLKRILGCRRFSCKPSLGILWFERCWVCDSGGSKIPGPLENSFIHPLLFNLVIPTRNSCHDAGGFGAISVLAANLCGGAICRFLSGILVVWTARPEHVNRISFSVLG